MLAPARSSGRRKTFEVPAEHVVGEVLAAHFVIEAGDVCAALVGEDGADVRSRRPVIGCIGSFEERKGQVVLLVALARARDDLAGCM